MTKSLHWAHIPAELRERAQWLVAGPSKAPLGIDAHGRTYNGSVSDPGTWCTFAVAAQYAYDHNLHIGYVITAADPYCCVDLDWTDEESQARKGKPVDPSKWSTQADINRYHLIVQTFASYTERSTYGKGLHIWVRGAIGTGCRREGVEVYSEARFIVCTGDRVAGTSNNVEDRQSLLGYMVEDMRKGIAERMALVPLEELPEDPDSHDCDDAFIFEIATNAENAHKFNELCHGNWEQYGYPSQSEADLALMSMFTFYSPINSQCRRLFRRTELGKRDKATKDNRYVDYTLKLIRNRIANESIGTIDVDNAANLIASLNSKEGVPLSSIAHSSVPHPLPAAVVLATLAENAPSADGALDFPPGFAGAVARFIYGSAPRPVKQVAIVGALGLLAGICGRAWHIPQSGLNIYVVLIARSGIGKEALHSGVSILMKACAMGAPAMHNFITFNDFASGPALVKFTATNNSVCNVAGEWGRKLKRLADDNSSDTAIGTLRSVMTNLYQKSGPQAIVGGIEYSNKDNNVASVSGVSFSMVGETTPDTFYEALTESMMADGFLSRFNVIEYTGDRPPPNMDQKLIPDKALVDHLSQLALQSSQINGTMGVFSQRESLLVSKTQEAAQMLHEFEKECDDQIIGSENESWRQMWNRAALKVMRIAALLAVGDDPGFPCVQPHHVVWSMDLVRRDVAIMRKKIEQGDVGLGDHSRSRKLAALVKEYLTQPPAASYKVPEKMHSSGVVPYSYLQVRASNLAVFTKNRLGATNSIAQAIKEFVDSGYFVEVDKGKAMVDYGVRAKCYMVVSLPEYKAK